MQTGRTEKIGNVVLDYSHYPEQDFYCDGASEDALLELVKTIPPREYPQEIYKAASWEVLYHLSDLRENIVGWLPVDKSMKVLEIGSGCGAITGRPRTEGRQRNLRRPFEKTQLDQRLPPSGP